MLLTFTLSTYLLLWRLIRLSYAPFAEMRSHFPGHSIQFAQMSRVSTRRKTMQSNSSKSLSKWMMSFVSNCGLNSRTIISRSWEYTQRRPNVCLGPFVRWMKTSTDRMTRKRTVDHKYGVSRFGRSSVWWSRSISCWTGFSSINVIFYWCLVSPVVLSFRPHNGVL